MTLNRTRIDSRQTDFCRKNGLTDEIVSKTDKEKDERKRGKQMTVDQENKLVFCDVANASKKEIAKMKQYVEQGYTFVSGDGAEAKGAPLPHNMGIHADMNLHF